MEKFPQNPIKKVNQIRKVTAAAIHLASMDPTHPALNQEGHIINAVKRPDTEIAQVQESTPAHNQSALDEQLKNSTADYFKNEKKDA